MTDMTEKSVTIAIIDDGVDFDKLYIQGNEISFVQNGYEMPSNNRISHGTVCTYIIKECIKEAKTKFVSVRILGNKGRGTARDFLRALNWCISNDIDIINCSLGSVENADFDKIKLVINQVVKANITVVAAPNNTGKYTLPACLPNVIGVKHNYKYSNGNYLLKWYPLDDIEVETSAVDIVMGSGLSNGKYIEGNSFAAPIITAQVADILYEYGKCNYYEVVKHLSLKAKKVLGQYHSNISPYAWNQEESNLSYDNEWNLLDYAKCFNSWIRPCKEEMDVPLLRVCGRNKYVAIFIDKFIEILKSNYTSYLWASYNKIFKGKSRPIVIPNTGNVQGALSCLYKKFLPDIIIVYSDDTGKYDMEVNLDSVSSITCGKLKEVFICDFVDHDSLSELMDRILAMLY